jgi:hypothetical protein
MNESPTYPSPNEVALAKILFELFFISMEFWLFWKAIDFLALRSAKRHRKDGYRLVFRDTEAGRKVTCSHP